MDDPLVNNTLAKQHLSAFRALTFISTLKNGDKEKRRALPSNTDF